MVSAHASSVAVASAMGRWGFMLPCLRPLWGGAIFPGNRHRAYASPALIGSPFACGSPMSNLKLANGPCTVENRPSHPFPLPRQLSTHQPTFREDRPVHGGDANGPPGANHRERLARERVARVQPD